MGREGCACEKGKHDIRIARRQLAPLDCGSAVTRRRIAAHFDTPGHLYIHVIVGAFPPSADWYLRGPPNDLCGRVQGKPSAAATLSDAPSEHGQPCSAFAAAPEDRPGTSPPLRRAQLPIALSRSPPRFPVRKRRTLTASTTAAACDLARRGGVT
jgi:hypothetical protein